MQNAARTSMQLGLRSSKRIVALAIAAQWLCVSAADEGTRPPPLSHCHSDERVEFSCRIGEKTVSLCAAGPEGHIDTLSYRYGVLGKVENEFTAKGDSPNHFFGTVMPARPGANVRQIWFDKGTVRYLLTQCVGGSCPYSSGLAVLRGERVLSKRVCQQPPPQQDSDTFKKELVSFGSNVGASHSNTPLLELGEYDNLLDKVYGGSAE